MTPWMRAAAFGFAALLFAGGGPSLASDRLAFEVEITNITARQVFTPIVLASHMPGVRLFTVGEPASIDLEKLAEAGDTGPLTVALRRKPEVLAVTTARHPLPPGDTLRLEVRAGVGFDHISLGAMPVPTNDAFFAGTDVRGPDGGQTSVLRVPAYDAGTELNDELCEHIPGPPMVCGGEGFNPSRVDAEGFVHIHRGIHGIGDLDEAERDWRNPVAEIRIRRIDR